jgi:predicted nucleic acid-binding protein
MTLALFDTNILIDATLGIDVALAEFSYYTDKAISVISWIEVMAGIPVAAPQQADAIKRFLAIFTLIHIDDAIAAEAARIRRQSIAGRKIALADALIQATAHITGRLIITRNKKDFRGLNVRIPYEIETVSTVKVINVRPPRKPSRSS